MSQNSGYTTDGLGLDRTLVREPLFSAVEELNSPFKTTPRMMSIFSGGVVPNRITSGAFLGNFDMVQGFLQSNNFRSGVNGWKFDSVGNLEANSGTFRGSIYAATGNIGGWIIDTNGLYYDGSGTPNIRTSTNVGAGSNGVIMDKDGIRGYDAVLGTVFNLYSNGNPPEFSSGVISQSTFEINTNAVLRTSDTVGDGSASSAGVLINDTGFYACGANQNLSAANVKILSNGDAFFSGTINASDIIGGTITSGTITGAVITGGTLRTNVSGQRIEIDSNGMYLYSGDTGATYDDPSFTYGNATRTYGTGVLAFINNSEVQVPVYFNAEQSVADLHHYNRSVNPSGAAEVGDVAFVNGRMRICISSGTPGNWAQLLIQSTSTSSSTVSTSTTSSTSSTT